jgi:hypothetical protein
MHNHLNVISLWYELQLEDRPIRTEHLMYSFVTKKGGGGTKAQWVPQQLLEFVSLLSGDYSRTFKLSYNSYTSS